MNSNARLIGILVALATAAQLAQATPNFMVLVRSHSSRASEPKVESFLSVASDDTLGQLKDKIRASTGIPQRKMELHHRETSLTDASKTLADYQIRPGDEIAMSYKQAGSFVTGRLYVNSRVKRNRAHPQYVEFQSPEDSVASVRSSIAKLLRLSVEQVGLNARGRKLEDHKTLGDYELDDDSEVNFSPRQLADGSFPVFVRSYSNDLADPVVQEYVTVMPSDTLTTLREKVYAKTGIAPGRPSTLYCRSSLTDDSKSLSDYHIQAGDEIELNLSHWRKQ